MAKYGMVIDLARCMGCNACVEACKVENNTGRGMFYMYLFRWEEGEYPNTTTQFLPRPCMHCRNAPCVKVCPTGARHRQEDGLVLTDYNVCIGCRYCEVACPYGVNSFNWKKPVDNQYFDWNGGEGTNVYGRGSVSDHVGDAVPPYENPDHDRRYGDDNRLVAGSGHFLGVVEKCTFCVHRLAKGLLPACVANCPVGTLHFGDFDDPESHVSQMLGQRKSFQLLAELGTDPRVYFVGGAPPGEGAHPLNPTAHKVELGR